MLILDEIDISSLIKAQEKLGAALKAPKSELNRDAAIKRFEFTIELSWKTMKKILAKRGSFINSPKPIIRESAKEKLLDDVESWFLFLEYRNRTSHTYDETVADELYDKLTDFYKLTDAFLSRIQNLKS